MTFCFRRFARFRYLVCFLLVALSACSKTDKGSGDTDGSAPAATGTRSLDSDLEQLQDFKLSMPRMQKWVQAQRNLVALSKARPDLEGTYKVEQNASLDQQVAALEGHADVRKAVRDAGVSPREFTLTTWAYMQAATAHTVQQMPTGKTRDSVMQSLKVHPENITFVQKNRSELETLMKEIER